MRNTELEIKRFDKARTWDRSIITIPVSDTTDAPLAENVSHWSQIRDASKRFSRSDVSRDFHRRAPISDRGWLLAQEVSATVPPAGVRSLAAAAAPTVARRGQPVLACPAAPDLTAISRASQGLVLSSKVKSSHTQGVGATAGAAAAARKVARETTAEWAEGDGFAVGQNSVSSPALSATPLLPDACSPSTGKAIAATEVMEKVPVVACLSAAVRNYHKDVRRRRSRSSSLGFNRTVPSKEKGTNNNIVDEGIHFSRMSRENCKSGLRGGSFVSKILKSRRRPLRDIVGSKGGQHRCQYFKKCVMVSQDKREDCSSIIEEALATVRMPENDNISQVWVSDDSESDVSRPLYLLAEGAEHIATRAQNACVVTTTSVVSHGAIPAAPVVRETEGDLHDSSGPQYHRFSGDSEMVDAAYLESQRQQQVGTFAPGDEARRSHDHWGEHEECEVCRHLEGTATCSVAASPRRAGACPVPRAEPPNREPSSFCMRPPGGLREDRARGEEGDHKREDTVAGTTAEGGKVRFSNCRSVNVATSHSRRCTTPTHRSSSRKAPFIILFVLQLCLCVALFITAWVEFSSLRHGHVDKTTNGTSEGGFPEGGDYNWARGSETLLQYMLLVPSLLACTCTLVNILLCSGIPHLLFELEGWQDCWIEILRPFRQQRDRRKNRGGTGGDVYLRGHHEYAFLQSSTTHGLRSHPSVIYRMPTRQQDRAHLRIRKKEAAALVSSLILALCGAALLMPSFVVWGDFCDFSYRDWTEEPSLRAHLSYSAAESQQAREHARRLCDHKALVLCSVFLTVLLSFTELLLLWLYRQVARAAGVAARAAAAAALAASLNYAHSATNRRQSILPSQKRVGDFHRKSISAPAAAAPNNSSHSAEPQWQQYKREGPNDETASAEKSHASGLRDGDAAGGRQPSPDSGRRHRDTSSIPESVSALAVSQEEQATSKKYRPFRSYKGDTATDQEREGSRPRELGKKRVQLMAEEEQERRQSKRETRGWQTGCSSESTEASKITEKRQEICGSFGGSCSLWEAVQILGYLKYLFGCVEVFIASLLLHEHACYRSLHAHLRTEALRVARGRFPYSSAERLHELEEVFVMPVTVGQEIELFFGSAVAGLMLLAGLNIVCGAYGTLVGWKRSPLLSSLNALLNAIIIWMEFAACVGLLFAAAGLNFFCNYTDYPVSQEPLPRFLASYVCHSSKPSFYFGWAATAIAFIIVFSDLIVDVVLLLREFFGKQGRTLPVLTSTAVSD